MTPPSLVLDASAVIALLLADTGAGQWIADVAEHPTLASPAVLTFEAANALRRLERAGVLDGTAAALAHADLLALPVQLWHYDATASRAWSLRENLTSYDASYVALAETLGAPLVTLDVRLASAPGVECEVLTPPR